jgi:hypothetical protein
MQVAGLRCLGAIAPPDLPHSRYCVHGQRRIIGEVESACACRTSPCAREQRGPEAGQSVGRREKAREGRRGGGHHGERSHGQARREEDVGRCE